MGSAAISDLVVGSSEVKYPESILKWKKISFVCRKKEDVGGEESGASWMTPSTQPGFTSQRDILRETAKQEATQVKNKRRGFSFALRKEEIKEDVFAVTGLKQVRMPKKRAEKVQK
ncbi:hypothetical protein SLEP1_g37011 [Rubroshorea leprosula]|uniref:Uncharacterized protein n=1 Tax=Rubroshorea leprosula TaxID=152421 RepID=A0AAV5KTW8_9ROSI|nr:hypothetical protein SLEP1_g37011 [Rubroshorea leprosula]